MSRFVSHCVAILLGAGIVLAQDQPDLQIVNRIRTEEFQHSQVMDTLENLTDRYGPRLTASPEFLEAMGFAEGRLKEYGLENVHREKWMFGRSWSLKQASVEMLEPRYSPLTAAALAWSDSTNGEVTGDAVLAPLGRGRMRLNLKANQEAIEKYEQKWKGKLRGKVVLVTSMSVPKPWESVPFGRYDEHQLAGIGIAPEPTPPVKVDPAHLEIPEDPQQARAYMMSLPPAMIDELYEKVQDQRAAFSTFLKNEGVAGVIQSDPRAHAGMVFAEAAGSYKAKFPLAPASFVVTAEQYDRMARLIEKGVPVKVRLTLKEESSAGDVDSYNLIGEIPGGARSDELIMVGAHFDSWHSGTGATDNGAGSAVMIEAMRILKALNLKMDRTVRIALWSGEEQGLLGSQAYVKEHFGDPKTMKITPGQAKLSGYFNLDNGTGKIRGVYLQGNDAMRPLFASWLRPFRDLGVSEITIRNTGGTDHLSFDAVGLPGFQFIQDPLDYMSITHHSDMDTYDHIQAGDMMQAAAVIASVVYDAATRPAMLPRKELPKAQPELPKTAPESSRSGSVPSGN